MSPVLRRSLIPLALLIALSVRIVWPHADPPARFSWSNGIFTDPATMVHGARNQAMYGEWVTDYNRDYYVFPLLNWLTYLSYLPNGPGRLPTLVLAALLGTLTVLGLAWGVARSAGWRAAVLAAFLAAVSPWLVTFSRIPVAENLTSVLLVFACAFAIDRRKSSQAAAGALAVTAVLFGKFHSVGFLPALVVFVTLRERRALGLLPVLAGGTAVFLAWVALFLLPHHADIVGHVQRQSTGLHGPLPLAKSLTEGVLEIYNSVRRCWMFFRMPVLGAVGGFFVFWSLLNREARRRAISDGTAIYALWFLTMWLYYAALPYKAPRYYVLLGPPLIACAAVQIVAMLRASDFRLRPPRGWGEHVPLLLWLYSFAFATIDAVKHWVSMSIEYLTIPPSKLSEETYNGIVFVFGYLDTFYQTLGWSVAITMFGYVWILWNPEIGRRLFGDASTMPAGLIQGSGRALVAASLALGVAHFGWWASHRTYFLTSVRASVTEMIGDGAVLLGPMAPLLGQDLDLEIHPYYGPPGERGLLEKYGVTHVVVAGKGEASQLEARYPGILSKLTIVHGWPLRSLFATTLEIFRVPQTVDGIPIHQYEPTRFEVAAELTERQEWTAAIAAYEEMRRMGDPVVPEMVSLEAVCWSKLEEFGRARELYEEAIRLRPEDPLNYQNMGVLDLIEGDRRAALGNWLTAVRLDPYNEELRKRLRELIR